MFWANLTNTLIADTVTNQLFTEKNSFSKTESHFTITYFAPYHFAQQTPPKNNNTSFYTLKINGKNKK